MNEYSLESLETLPLPTVGDVRRIYEEGFPPHQRTDFAEVSERRRGAESALALVRGGQPCGFAMLRSLGDTGWIYLQVTPDQLLRAARRPPAASDRVPHPARSPARG